MLKVFDEGKLRENYKSNYLSTSVNAALLRTSICLQIFRATPIWNTNTNRKGAKHTQADQILSQLCQEASNKIQEMIVARPELRSKEAASQCPRLVGLRGWTANQESLDILMSLANLATGDMATKQQSKIDTLQ